MAANFPPNGGGSGGGAVDSVNGKTGTVVIGKVDIGLGSVDNTSDADKPISTLAQAALDAKQDTLVSGTNIKTINGKSVLGSGNMDIGGSLQYLTEVRNTTAPNATVPVHGVQATGAEANIDLLLQQKGTGAIVAQVPDGTTAGGNKRGANAVDLQTSRTANTHVASGANSVIAGGGSNTASCQNATVSGGGSNIALGQNATVSGGQTNSASGTGSTIPGGRLATTNGISGLLAYGFNGQFQGQNQMAFWGGRKNTTNDTPTRITADATGGSSSNQLTLRNGSAFRVKGTVVARDTTSNDCKEWTFEALIKRGASASTTTIVGTPTIASTFADTAAASWSIDVTADTTNGALSVTAIGETGKAIRWTCVVHSIEVA